MQVGDLEHRLWLNVILRAQWEATGKYRLENRQVSVSAIHQFQAQRYLTNEPLDQFRLVCELAGLSKEQYVKLRDAARQQYGVVGQKHQEAKP